MLNTKLEVLKYPHDVLSTPSEDIEIMGPNRRDYLQFIDQMMEMYNGGSDWGYMVGLAAPQVGRNWNIFIALGEVFINPKIEIDTLKGFSWLKEGCYSLEKDKFDYEVKRWFHIIVEWVDVNGEPQRKHFRGRDAQVILHEWDHIRGLCCVDVEAKSHD